ncbi:serine hydrolase [Streptacidiphilus monticola]|uniref:Serine hydrolase n=1 Tax=Streptacidiphilus monticola TaxID=2161674 RepID=A0ABW1G6A6_9ACTN
MSLLHSGHGGTADIAATAATSPAAGSQDHATPSASRAAQSPSPRPTTASPKPTPTVSTAGVRRALAAAEGHASVAAVDLTTGQGLAVGGGGHRFVDASISKADILATLLLQAQDRGRGLTSGQRALATRMIQNSDNSAANSLYGEIGGASGMAAANKRFGMTATTPGAGGLWGLTTTTAKDQLVLLRNLFTSESKLSAASRGYVAGLMATVETDQRWGVSAAASGDDYALKNGWLPRSGTGLWVVNSIGRVVRDGHTLLIAAVSDGNPTEAQGIALVESAARAAGQALTGG